VMRIDAPPPSMSTLRADIPDAIDAVVRRALEPDRDKRWPDLDSFLNALREAHETGKIPANLVPAEALARPSGPAGVDQETALSHANAPTVAGTGDAAAAPAPVEPARRSARAWVIAAVAGLLLAAAGGYGGYELVMSRPVTVVSGSLAVQVPREWSEKSITGGEVPELLVSTDTQHWQTGDVPGIYMGMRTTATLPTKPNPPTGCTAGTPSNADVGSQVAVTFNYTCGKNTVIEQYVRTSESRSVWIQVRGTDADQLQTILSSATYG
jgi:eukaryotic-like serine/threonine-protein kinase